MVTPLAERYKFPLLLSAQLSEREHENPWAVRTVAYAETYSGKMMEYLRSRGFKKIGIVKAELSFYNNRVAGLREALQSGESVDVLYERQPTDTDLSSVVTALKNKQFDVLGLYLTPQQTARFYRAAEEQGLTLTTFGDSAYESRDLIKQSGRLMDGAVFVHNETSEDFRRRYAAAFKKDNELPWAALAYDTAILIGERLHDQPSLKAQEILERFKSFPERQGVSGKFKPNYQKGVGTFYDFPVVIKQISGNDFKVVYR